MKRITVKVTTAHLNESLGHFLTSRFDENFWNGHGTHCPLAIAIREQVSGNGIRVFPSWACLDDEGFEKYHLSPAAVQFVKAYDHAIAHWNADEPLDCLLTELPKTPQRFVLTQIDV